MLHYVYLPNRVSWPSCVKTNINVETKPIRLFSYVCFVCVLLCWLISVLNIKHKTRLHIGKLVKDTSAKLKEASESDHGQDVVKSKKIADAKLAKDFELVLKEFQKAQWIAAERETSYTPFDPKGSLSSRCAS